MSDVAHPSAAPPRHCLERGVPLSRSILWELQRRYFAREGAAAFRPGHVPSYVTNNPVWARTAAELTVAYLRDLARHDPSVDLDRPFYVLELGAGSGRFAYAFVRHLAEALARSGLDELDVVYVLSDMSAATRAFWRTHPCIAPLVAAGRIDIAAFDAGASRTLALERSGVVLGPGDVVNPLVVIGNYLFDSLPQDLFSTEDGRLFEHLATTHSPERDLDHPRALALCEVGYHTQAVALPHYGDPGLDLVLEQYQASLARGTFSLPCIGLRLIDQLAALARGRLLLVAADKGHLRPDELVGDGALAMAQHGSFSMMVNFDAVARAVRARGGTALVPAHPQAGIAFLAFVLGGAAPETIRTYADHVERFGPSDFIALRKATRRGMHGWTLAEILAYWRLAEWDWSVLLYAAGAILDAIPGAEPEQRAELEQAARRAWDLYYPVHGSDDIAFELGLVMAELGAVDDALELFEHARLALGPSAPVAYNTALCHVLRGDDARGRAALAEALGLDPDHPGARALAAHLDAEVAA